MSLKTRALLVLLVGTALGLTLSLGGALLAERHSEMRTQQTGFALLGIEQLRLLDEVLERVRSDYVDDIDERRLIESAIRGILGELDVHSQFLDASALDDLMVSTTGQYGGVGLELNVVGDQVRVVTPMDGTPAQQAGIRPGDVLVSVDDLAVDSADLRAAVARMRGRPGSEVTLGVVRDGEELRTYRLVRQRVAVRSVRSDYIPGGYGYVRITQFSQGTAGEVREAMATLHRLGGGQLRGAILDLRNNPGGVLDAAVEVADAFLDSGVIVRGEGRLEESSFERRARPGDVLEGAPLVVLVNAGSASASEIVAAALQDHRRATLVGTVTHGKGSVQTVMPLSSGTAIKLTTSRYFTPSGATIHEQGIRPDLEVVQGEGSRRTAVFGPEHLDQDPQLQAALNRLRAAQSVAVSAPR